MKNQINMLWLTHTHTRTRMCMHTEARIYLSTCIQFHYLAQHNLWWLPFWVSLILDMYKIQPSDACYNHVCLANGDTILCNTFHVHVAWSLCDRRKLFLFIRDYNYIDSCLLHQKRCNYHLSQLYTASKPRIIYWVLSLGLFHGCKLIGENRVLICKFI